MLKCIIILALFPTFGNSDQVLCCLLRLQPELRLGPKLRYPAEASAHDLAGASALAEAGKVRSGRSLMAWIH